jgi:hypothetical protein
MIVLVHTRVGSSEDADEAAGDLMHDVAPGASSPEALNTILVVSPGHPSMWLFK